MNVCFILSLREIKYDEHKSQKLLFIAAYQKKIETNNMKLMIVTVFKIKKSMLIQYVLEQGWEVYNIYSDDDYTGSDRRRPEFNKLLNDAEHRKFDIILCKTQSRFTRELELVEKIHTRIVSYLGDSFYQYCR